MGRLRRSGSNEGNAMARAPGEGLPADLKRWVGTNFGAGDVDAALACLEAAVLHTGEPAGPRLLRCAALAAAGDLERLRRQVERLRVDWRDVVVEGEYAVLNGRLARVRNLAEPLPD